MSQVVDVEQNLAFRAQWRPWPARWRRSRLRHVVLKWSFAAERTKSETPTKGVDMFEQPFSNGVSKDSAAISHNSRACLNVHPSLCSPNSSYRYLPAETKPKHLPINSFKAPAGVAPQCPLSLMMSRSLSTYLPSSASCVGLQVVL